MEYDTVEFVEHGLVKALANAVGLRAPDLGAQIIDVLDGEVATILSGARNGSSHRA